MVRLLIRDWSPSVLGVNGSPAAFRDHHFRKKKKNVILDQTGVQNDIKIGFGGTPAEGSRTKSKKGRFPRETPEPFASTWGILIAILGPSWVQNLLKIRLLGLDWHKPPRKMTSGRGFGKNMEN